ncbi:MAG TPA: permease-like cell division protein FtsX [Acidimicrobiia bacterium]|nr:permease-like cell division protein FtsX [Acidimicrobiia bacterium]
MLAKLRYFARETLISLRRNLLMTLAGIITVTVSLSVLGTALLVSRLVDHGTAKWKHGVRFEVFMNVDATQNQIDAVREAISSSPQVKSYQFIDKPQALKEFKRLTKNEPELSQDIDANALPESFRVAPKKAEQTETLADQFRVLPGVKTVVTARQALKTIFSVTNWIKRAFTIAFVLLLAAALFLIVNTVRLATFARRREIEVMKLVGASNWFVRIPFLAEGFVQGIIGAGLAFAVVYFLKVRLSSALAGGSGFVQTFFLTTRDAWSIGFLVLILGAAIGVIASAVGLRRFLDV